MNTAPKLSTRDKLKELLSSAYHHGRNSFHFNTGDQADKFLAALAPPSGEGVEYVDADDVFLSQGTDDVPCLQVPGRILARFIPGSWDRAYSLFSGNTPAPHSTGTLGGGVLISHDELKAWRELVDISPSQVQLEISAMLSATPQSAPVDGEFVLVPREPTQAMRSAMYMAQHYDMSVQTPDEWGAVDKAYAAMVSAAPTPPPASQERGGETAFHGRMLAKRADESLAYFAVNIERHPTELFAITWTLIPSSPELIRELMPHGAKALRKLADQVERAAMAASPPSSAAEVANDDELPGMWSNSDFTGGATDAAEQASPCDHSPAVWCLKCNPTGADPLSKPAEQAKPDDNWIYGDGERIGLPPYEKAEQAQAGESREARMVVVERDNDGKPTVWCDPEIVDLVTALNAAGIRTVASCSGHGEQRGNIALADGRELLIAPSFKAARKMEAQARELPPDIEGLAIWLTHRADEAETYEYHDNFNRSAALLRRLAGGVTVDDAMVERAKDACVAHGAYFAPETDGEWRAALVAALGAR